MRELIYLNRIVAKHGGIFVTHMRNEADYSWSALDEVFEISRASDAHLHISQSWLRVFRSANTAHLGHRGGHER